MAQFLHWSLHPRRARGWLSTKQGYEIARTHGGRMGKKLHGLFTRLLGAGTEDVVQAILEGEGLADGDDRWTPYGDNESF